MSLSIARIVRKTAGELVNSSLQEPILNLRLVLRKRLEQEGLSSLEAAEMSESWTGRLLEEINAVLADWDWMGVPRPIVPSSAPNILITYRHERYLSSIGGMGLSVEYGEVAELISRMSPREFLLVPICLLRTIGCNPIIVTDGPGDGGVDCIGQIALGPTRSLCIFMQARTGAKNITKADVQLEYSKFCDLRNTGQFTEYLAALGKGTSRDGISICYAMVASTEFEQPAREYALREEILLRSRRQIAFWLSQRFGRDRLRGLLTELGDTLVRDLSRNLAPLLGQYYSHGESSDRGLVF